MINQEQGADSVNENLAEIIKRFKESKFFKVKSADYLRDVDYLARRMSVPELQEFLDSMPKNSNYGVLIGSIAEAIYRIDEEKLREWLSLLGPDQENGSAFWKVGQASVEKGVPTWIETIESKRFKDSFYRAYLDEMIENDPQKGATELLRLMQSGASLEATDSPLNKLADAGLAEEALEILKLNPKYKHAPAWDSFVASWSRNDPQAALDYVKSYGLDNFDPQLLPALITDWAKRDSIAASTYVDEHKNDPAFQDKLIPALVDSMAQLNPADGLPWALAIHDADSRRQSLEKLLFSMHYDSPSRAQEALQSLQPSLSPEEYSGLANFLEQKSQQHSGG